MPEPMYRIFYGKYPDNTPNEIPNAHVADLDPIQLRIEPGKPAEPKVENVSFTVSNKNEDGTERYDRAWIDQQSRSQAEGGTIADQLFFRIEFTQRTGRFIGVLDGRTYSTYRSTVEFTIKSPLAIISKSEKRMFKPFSFDSCYLHGKRQNDDFTNDLLPRGKDLEGIDLTDELLVFENVLSTDKQYVAVADLPKSFGDFSFPNHPYAAHRDLQGKLNAEEYTAGAPPEAIIWSETRLAFVKIGDITLLTWLNEAISYYSDPDENLQCYLQLRINHAANGNYNFNDGTVLERSRFFADDQGTDLKEGDTHGITILDYDVEGQSSDIMMGRQYAFIADETPRIMNGYEINYQANGSNQGTYEIANTFNGYFDMLSVLTTLFEGTLLQDFYQGASNFFDKDKTPEKGKQAFWADILLYGWADTKPGDMLVNLATQLNCYIYFNEDEKLVFQDRLHHDKYLPSQLPPDAFAVKEADIAPLGYNDSNNGFDSYSVEYNDRIPMNNIESDAVKTEVVDSEGIRQNATLRNTDLEVQNYRSDDLGVPTLDDPVDQLQFRYSPNDPRFAQGFGNLGEDLETFIPTPAEQAQKFSKSFEYPVELWSIKWDMGKYPYTKIGGYFYTTMGGQNTVYFIRELSFDFDKHSYNMKVQKVGVWDG